jgi:GDP-D-mannose dehydratase
MSKKALIVAVTGIVGTSLGEHLLTQGWEVFGLSMRPSSDSSPDHQNGEGSVTTTFARN